MLVSSIVKTSYDKRNRDESRNRNRNTSFTGDNMYLNLKIKVPIFIESIIVYFVLRYRKKKYGYPFRKIKLAKSELADAKHRYAIIDPEDYGKVAIDEWQLYKNKNNNCYAARLDSSNIVYMHRVIMNAPAGKIVDHQNREGLDNRKSNLRLATRSQNNCNRKQKKGTSKYRGVCCIKPKKWRAYISFNGIYKHLGYFENEEDAARAYDKAAKELHREFAVLNFPPSPNETPLCGAFPRHRSGG
jgi:hypothetical protein